MTGVDDGRALLGALEGLGVQRRGAGLRQRWIKDAEVGWKFRLERRMEELATVEKKTEMGLVPELLICAC